MKSSLWPVEDLEKLMTLLPSTPHAELAVIFGRSPGAIRKVIKRHSIKDRIRRRVGFETHPDKEQDKGRWPDDEKQRFAEAWMKESVLDISLMFGISADAVRYQGKAQGLPKRRDIKRIIAESMPSNLAPLELAPGHFAVDQRSYDLLREAIHG